MYFYRIYCIFCLLTVSLFSTTTSVCCLVNKHILHQIRQTELREYKIHSGVTSSKTGDTPSARKAAVITAEFACLGMMPLQNWRDDDGTILKNANNGASIDSSMLASDP